MTTRDNARIGNNGVIRTICLTLLCLLLPVAVSASAGLPPLGPRAGYTHHKGLDQWHVGAHARLGELFPNVEATPGVELGFGSHTAFVTVNGDATYRATELVASPWGLHLGGSLSFNYFDWRQGSDVHLGLSALAAVSRELGLGQEVFGEVRIGILDSPRLKVTFGVTFF